MKSFLGPLLLTFAIAVFVLLMQFVWKYIDDLVGKGLEVGVIAQLMLYASATFVPMALPIAVLFASIMTMGNFSEKYELAAMKAGGISVRRIMMPMAVLSLLLVGVAFYFANNVLPRAMFKYRTTLYDIQRKKPAVSIRTNTFYDEIDGYVIRINGKGSDGKTLHDILIYDHTQGITNTNVIVADSGMMEMTPDNHYLLFSLYNGHTYSEPSNGENYITRPYTDIGFKEQIITFDISSFAYQESDSAAFEGYYQLLNVHQMDSAVQTLSHVRDSHFAEYCKSMLMRMRVYQYGALHAADSTHYVSIEHRLAADSTGNLRKRVLEQATANATNAVNDIEMYSQMLMAEEEYIDCHYVEWMRKYTLSVACLLLFLIGAPFGSIVRKGGMGMPLVASVVFFVLYYVIGMIAEKSVRSNAAGPIGMWVSTFAFIPIGAFLTWLATTDSSILDLSSWKKWLHIKEDREARRELSGLDDGSSPE